MTTSLISYMSMRDIQSELSVGILYSCRELLRYIDETRLAARDLHKFFDKFYVADSKIVSQLSQQCNWLTVSEDGVLETTVGGREVACETAEGALRIQMMDFILCARPPWSGLIPRGREEAAIYFPDDVRQCFKEAGLLDSQASDVVEWWDNLAGAARGCREENLTAIGREGERSSLKHERHRTDRAPTWTAIESNLAGYDIESVVSSSDHTRLFIEVKASELAAAYAHVYITENEWRVATTCGQYVLHLWVDLRKDRKLFIVPLEAISRHIPENCGDGNWRAVKIPALSLADGLTPEKVV